MAYRRRYQGCFCYGLKWMELRFEFPAFASVVASDDLLPLEVCTIENIEIRRLIEIRRAGFELRPGCLVQFTRPDSCVPSCAIYQSSSTSSARTVSSLSHAVISFLVLKTLAKDSACLMPIICPINSNRVMIQERIPAISSSIVALR